MAARWAPTWTPVTRSATCTTRPRQAVPRWECAGGRLAAEPPGMRVRRARPRRPGRTPRRRLLCLPSADDPRRPRRRGATLSSSGAVLVLAIVGCLAAIGALAVLVVVLRRVGLPGSTHTSVVGDGLSPAETARLKEKAD